MMVVAVTTAVGNRGVALGSGVAVGRIVGVDGGVVAVKEGALVGETAGSRATVGPVVAASVLVGALAVGAGIVAVIERSAGPVELGVAIPV